MLDPQPTQQEHTSMPSFDQNIQRLTHTAINAPTQPEREQAILDLAQKTQHYRDLWNNTLRDYQTTLTELADLKARDITLDELFPPIDNTPPDAIT